MKENDFNNIIRDLSPEGTHRVLVLTGNDHVRCTNKLVELGRSIVGKNPHSFFIHIDGANIDSPEDWCSHFARNLKTGTSLNEDDLYNFALSVGKTLGSIGSALIDKREPADEDKKGLADLLIEHFDDFLSRATHGKKLPHILLSISGLHKTSDSLREWLVKDLNHALRRSSNFKKCRFLFSTDKQTEAIESFFNQFGFEKVHYKELIDSQKNYLPKTDSSKLLDENMNTNSSHALLRNFTDSELNYLILCSYPHRVSKYTLGHFVSDRDAALAFNWLSRQKNIRTIHDSGDFVLDDSLKSALRSFHAEQNPEQAEEWNIHASVVDAFHLLFPNDSSHWIPLNLQLLQSFKHAVVQNLFADDQATEIIEFIESNTLLFTEIDDNLALTDEAKIVTRRFMEVSGLTIIPGLEVSIRELWLRDLNTYNTRKSKLDEERENISTEIEETLLQVGSINNAKDELLESFRNPRKNKPQKVYSFTTSRLLIVIGFATVGASLLSENIGSYHAACGLALSLFGFFWPNVETKRPAFATGGPTSNLAIETQQRSLNHRISSLSNRVQVMKGNLNVVEKHLEKLGDAPPPPYLDSEQSEG
jgi:hypothetical protein